MGDADRYARAIALFDAANAEDPNRDATAGASAPREFVYAQRMSAALDRYAPDASEALRLAARCQHLQRWKRPRGDYPMTRVGYNSWRTNARQFHAEVAGELLRRAGYDDVTIDRVSALLRKENLKSDAESQTLEDVVGLVFLEHYLADFVAAHGQFDEPKLRDILAKTARKMSARGRAAACALAGLPPPLAPLIRQVMSG
jgi:hypothetical protein